MLPGFRFLFSAIILSMSLLIFGLGAAALLRAAHEEFASNPTWRAPAETVFAQPSEPAKPVLAALVVEPPAEQRKPETAVTAPDATAAIDLPPADSKQVEAPKPDQAAPPELAKSETAAESSRASEPAPAPLQPSVAVEAPAPTTDIRIAAIESPPSTSETAAPLQVSAPAVPEVDKTTAVATSGAPLVAVETPPPSNADQAAADKKKRLRARRARERRRIAALRRAELARLAQQQPATDLLFGQTPIQPPQLR